MAANKLSLGQNQTKTRNENNHILTGATTHRSREGRDIILLRHILIQWFPKSRYANDTGGEIIFSHLRR
jgi:hypothetical protein